MSEFTSMPENKIKGHAEENKNHKVHNKSTATNIP